MNQPQDSANAQHDALHDLLVRTTVVLEVCFGWQLVWILPNCCMAAEYWYNLLVHEQESINSQCPELQRLLSKAMLILESVCIYIHIIYIILCVDANL